MEREHHGSFDLDARSLHSMNPPATAVVGGGGGVLLPVFFHLTFVGSMSSESFRGPVAAAVACVGFGVVNQRGFALSGVAGCRGKRRGRRGSIEALIRRLSVHPVRSVDTNVSSSILSTLGYNLSLALFIFLSLFIFLALSLSLWIIEAHGCAWQNYWAVQPIGRWHSPLKSLPRSLACWMKRVFSNLKQQHNNNRERAV